MARANIHHQQIVKLLKQRNRVHASLVYQQHRMATLEQSLCAHAYALIDADRDELKPAVAALVCALHFLIDDKLTSEQLLARYQQESMSAEEADLAEAIELLCSLLPATYLNNKLAIKFDNAYLEQIVYRNSQLVELLAHFAITWPIEALQVMRQSALAEQFSPSLTLACLLFGQDKVTSQELAQGYKHAQFSIAKASFVKGLAVDKLTAKNALFNRFAKTESLTEKADLLALAGLSGDSRWIEPCSIFCKDYPEHTFEVLSHFQHKIFLTISIELMAVAQTSDNAYQAWLLLTDKPLLKKPQLQDSKNKHQQAGELNVPNTDQAELHRQALMQQSGQHSGEKVLAGISFDDNNAAQKLAGLQGRAVQQALILSHRMSDGMSLYCRQLSSTALSEIMQQGDKSKMVINHIQITPRKANVA